MRRVLAVSLLLSLLACGRDEPVPLEAGGPSATLDPPEVGDEVADGCGDAGEASTASLPEHQDDPEGARVSVGQDELFGDVERLVAYGEQHQEVWGGFRFENGCPVRLVVSVTEDLAVHEEALRALVDHPEQLAVEQAERTQDDLRRIQDEVVAEAGDHFVGAGQRAGIVRLELRADGLEVARRLHQRYGDALEITVGTMPFPPGEGVGAGGASASGCGSVAPPGGGPPGLVVRLELERSEVPAGDDFAGTAVVANEGDDDISIESGQPLTATVVRRGESQVVGIFVGAIAGTGLTLGLMPGEEVEIAVLGGTASCDPDAEPALAPGEYDVVVALPLDGPDGAPEGSAADVATSAPVPLVIVAG